MRSATRTTRTTSKVFEPELVVEIVCGVAVGCGVAVATAVAVGCGARVGRGVAVAAGSVAVAAVGGVAVGCAATVGAAVAVGSGGVAVCAGRNGLAARRCPCWSADAVEIAACAVAPIRSISARAQMPATSATAPARQRMRRPAGARPEVALVRVLRCSGIRFAPLPRAIAADRTATIGTGIRQPLCHGSGKGVMCPASEGPPGARRAATASAVAPAAHVRLYSPVSSRLGDMLHVKASERARQSRSISE